MHRCLIARSNAGTSSHSVFLSATAQPFALPSKRHASMAAAATAAPEALFFKLLSLPMHLVEAVVGHVSSKDRLQLMRTCKVLREMVLEKASVFRLDVGGQATERSRREIRAVVRRHRPIRMLTLNIMGCAPEHAQQLLSALAAEPAGVETPCAVTALTIDAATDTDTDTDDTHKAVDISCWGSLLGAAFPNLTFLELDGVLLDLPTLQGLSQCRLEKLHFFFGEIDQEVTHHHLASCLPAVREVGVSWDEERWLSGLGHRLTKLVVRVEDAPMGHEALLALAKCVHLEEVEFDYVNLATLDVLLSLPCLTRVSALVWDAHMDRRICNWSEFECGLLTGVEEVNILP